MLTTGKLSCEKSNIRVTLMRFFSSLLNFESKAIARLWLLNFLRQCYLNERLIQFLTIILLFTLLLQIILADCQSLCTVFFFLIPHLMSKGWIRWTFKVPSNPGCPVNLWLRIETWLNKQKDIFLIFKRQLESLMKSVLFLITWSTKPELPLAVKMLQPSQYLRMD